MKAKILCLPTRPRYFSRFLLSYSLIFYVARVERLELPTNGFGDHYSTN
jgi:hypothetical protein